MNGRARSSQKSQDVPRSAALLPIMDSARLGNAGDRAPGHHLGVVQENRALARRSPPGPMDSLANRASAATCTGNRTNDTHRRLLHALELELLCPGRRRKNIAGRPSHSVRHLLRPCSPPLAIVEQSARLGDGGPHAGHGRGEFRAFCDRRHVCLEETRTCRLAR